MLLHVLSSESAGNLYLLQSESECLVIEAGIHLKVVKHALGHDMSKVVGALQSHRHFDHSKYIKGFMAAGIDCYTSQDVIESQNLNGHRIHPILPGNADKIGQFTVLAFTVPHGDCPNLGFLIMHPEAGKILFVTDCSHIPNKFVGLNTIMLEINYGDSILTNDRAIGKHFSLDNAVAFLRTTDLRQVRNIILLHLSSSNSDSREFVRQVQEVAVRALITVADRGVSIDISRHPF